jgi:hypothetical protein
VALTEGDLAEQEVVLELGPLLPRCGPLLGERPRRAPLLDEVLMRSDHLLGEHGRIAAGGVEVEVTEQGRGDVERRSAEAATSLRIRRTRLVDRTSWRMPTRRANRCRNGWA